MKRSGKGRVADIWIQEDILYCNYHSDTILTLEKAQEIVMQRLEVQKDKYYPVYCDINGLRHSHKEAREYLAKHGSMLTTAVAYLASDHYSYRMISFFIRNSKPRIPSKVFRHKFHAINYLRRYKK